MDNRLLDLEPSQLFQVSEQLEDLPLDRPAEGPKPAYSWAAAASASIELNHEKATEGSDVERRWQLFFGFKNPDRRVGKSCADS